MLINGHEAYTHTCCCRQRPPMHCSHEAAAAMMLIYSQLKRLRPKASPASFSQDQAAALLASHGVGSAQFHPNSTKRHAMCSKAAASPPGSATQPVLAWFSSRPLATPVPSINSSFVQEAAAGGVCSRLHFSCLQLHP